MAKRDTKNHCASECGRTEVVADEMWKSHYVPRLRFLGVM